MLSHDCYIAFICCAHNTSAPAACSVDGSPRALIKWSKSARQVRLEAAPDMSSDAARLSAVSVRITVPFHRNQTGSKVVMLCKFAAR